MFPIPRTVKMTLLIAFALCSVAHGQGQLLILISSKETAKHMVPLLPVDLKSERDRITHSKGVIVDVRDFWSIDRVFLRTIVTEARKPLFVFGPEVAPRELHEMLGIKPRITVVWKDSKERIRASGIYKREAGGYYAIDILSRAVLPAPQLLSYIKSAVDRMLSIESFDPLPREPKPKGPSWEDDGSIYRQEFNDPETKGDFHQEAKIYFLANDESDKSDWWYLRIHNTILPDDAMTKLNRNNARGDNAIGLPCWGSIGVVGYNQLADVKVGCPGPMEEWHWPTGMTTVTDKTIAENREARWDVDFKVGQKDSRFAYEWGPGVQYETPQIPGEKKMLRVLMNVFVEWQNSQGQVMPWDVGRWYYEYRRP